MTPVQFAASGAVPTSMKENSTTRESSNTEIDQSTIDAMVRLEIEDIIETANNSNDRQSQERCEDSHLALELYIQELLYANGILNDHKSADTFALEQVVAIQSGSIVSQIKEEEDQDGTEAPQLPKYSEELNYSGHTTGSSWKNAYRSHQADLSDFRRDLETSLPRICVSCIEEKAASEFFTVPCLHQHEFCRDCLARMFEILLAEEASFPPQCDGVDIPFPDAYFSLPADLNERIVSKLPELLATKQVVPL